MQVTKKLAFKILVAFSCSDIMSDHMVKLVGQFRNLVGQYPMTDCYFQHCCGADGRTDVRTDGRSHDYYITTKISCLDGLPNLLSNGAPLRKHLGWMEIEKPDSYPVASLFSAVIFG